MLLFLPAEGQHSIGYWDAKDTLESYLSTCNDSPTVSPPFRFIHPDLDSQNILLNPNPSTTAPPTISGIIDWEGARTGPLYFFYEYPTFIQDTDDYPDRYTDNKILRKYFMYMLCESFPKDTPEQAAVLLCMKKNFILNGFKSRIMDMIAYGLVDMIRIGRRICE